MLDAAYTLLSSRPHKRATRSAVVLPTGVETVVWTEASTGSDGTAMGAHHDWSLVRLIMEWEAAANAWFMIQPRLPSPSTSYPSIYSVNDSSYQRLAGFSSAPAAALTEYEIWTVLPPCAGWRVAIAHTAGADRTLRNVTLEFYSRRATGDGAYPQPAWS